MKSFLYAWAQQNYVAMLGDKHRLLSAPKNNLHTLLGLFIALSFYENHVNTTKAARKGQKLEYNGFTDKGFKYTPVYWDRWQAKSGKLMFVANYTIVDWEPHSIRLSNCSDDINSTMCDYVIQVT